MNTHPFDNTNAVWMWPAEKSGQPNQYVQFRQQFELPKVEADSTLYISVDSNYTVWINGQLVSFGQYNDYPECKAYDSLPVAKYLKEGSNTIAVLAFYQGVDSFQYIISNPGLIYSLVSGSASVSSGVGVFYRVSPNYITSDIAKVTPQLGFNFEYRAIAEYHEWRDNDYAVGRDWTSIKESDTRGVEARPLAQPRPIDKLVLGDRLHVNLVDQGWFKQDADKAEEPVAKQMQAAKLTKLSVEKLLGSAANTSLPSSQGLCLQPVSVKDADGAFMIFDMGREEAGYLDLELEASEGTIVDVAWGEHLEDGHVRASVGGRCFASRYVCCDGKQKFTHFFLRMAGRYIQLHISSQKDACVINYAGLLPVHYPVVENGSFRCSNDILDQIYQTSIRTLQLCMHEHYEDCPWREQALYAMDMRNQALCGYTAFGDPKFAAASLELLGRGLKADGYLELCAPAEISITIPCFSMAWIIALADHLMYTGDTTFASKQLERVKLMLDIYHNSLDEGLLQLPVGKRYWHFYEWADGLEGAHSGRVQPARKDAPLNLFYSLALEAASKLAHYCGDQQLADSTEQQQLALNTAIHKKFWNQDALQYWTYTDNAEHYAELTQSLALLAGVVPNKYAPQLREKLAHRDNGMIRATLSYSIYKYEALLQQSDEYGKFAIDDLRKDWGYMLSKGATSFWETIKGAADFDDAGSLCHGWSGIPVYFWHAYILGIKPLEPGFARFSVAPLPGVVDSAEGAIATPHGTISVKVSSGVPQVNHPAGTVMVSEGEAH